MVLGTQVSAGAEAGAEVVRLLAVDGDSGDNGRLEYDIVDGELLSSGEKRK